MTSSRQTSPSTSIFYGYIIRHPKMISLLWLLLAMGLTIPASTFEVDASADTLLTNNNQAYLNTRRVNQQFSPEEFLIIAYHPKQGTVLEQNALERMTSLSKALSKLERVKVVRSLLNVPLLTTKTIAELDSDLESTSIENNHYTTPFLSQLFKDHPIYEDLLISKNQQFAALQIVFKRNIELFNIDKKLLAFDIQIAEGSVLSENEKNQYESLRQSQQIREAQAAQQRSDEYLAIKEIIEPYNKDAVLYLGGIHVIGEELINIVESDLLSFGVTVLAVISLLLLVAFRSFRWLSITLICSTLCIIITVGVLSLLSFKATVVSANFVALQLILILALIIHLIIHYLEIRKEKPNAPHETVLIETLQSKTKPSVFAAVTTSVGFISLTTADVQPVIYFGIIMLIATLVLLAVCLTLFPAVTALLINNKHSTREFITGERLTRLAHKLIAKPLMIVSVYMIITCGLGLGIAKLTVENSFINYFDESTDVYKGLTVIDENLGGTTPLDIIVTIPDAHKKQDLEITARSVQSLQQIHEMLEGFDSMGSVLSIYSFTELAKKINQGKPLTEYELNAIYKLAEPAVRNELIGSFYDKEQQQIRVSARIIDSTPGLNRHQLLGRIDTLLFELGFDRDQYMTANLLVVYDEILQKLFTSQILTIAIVFVALLTILVILFRSWQLAIIAIAPNIAATVSLLGVIGWLNIPLDFMTITIAAISMGIATDDTIHYLFRYLEELKTTDAKTAISVCHRTVGKSVCLTSIVVILGFMVMFFSHFIPSKLFGLLTGLSMGLALIATLVLLPILLITFFKESRKT